jgi:hypothetical protein
MMLPDIFAIYQRNSKSFHLIQLVKDKKGAIQCITSCILPDFSKWNDFNDELKAKFSQAWCDGNEWFVEPTVKIGETSTIHTVNIDDKDYQWWSLHHSLVWSNQDIYNLRDEELCDKWNACPAIHVIEFSPAAYCDHINYLINSTIIPNWALSTPKDIEDEMGKAAIHYNNIVYDEIIKDHVDPRYLKIKTPKVKRRDIPDYETSEDEIATRAPKHYKRGLTEIYEPKAAYCNAVALITMMLLSVGTYIYICAAIVGY